VTENFSFRTNSPEETRRFGRELGELLRPGDFVGLTGPLGSGKTVVIQGAAVGLGFEGYVTSPTFIIVNEYSGRVPIEHVDLYRITDARELEDIGYREFFFGDGVALVEWADRVPELLPETRLDVAIVIAGEEAREFSVSAHGDTVGLLRELERSWAGG
jgi:tRNA threonylcarbamoyladenosine biosynthesis protein TsaE